MYVVAYLHKKGLRVGLNELSDKVKLGKITSEIRGPGEPVPEAEAWKEHVINANLRLGWIQTEAEYNETKAKYETEREKTQDRHKRRAVSSKSVSEKKELADKPDPSGSPLSKAELMDMCRDKGLTVRGTKKQLVERLAEHNAAMAS